MIEESVRFDIDTKTEISAKQIKQEEKHIKAFGNALPHNGHTVFRINPETMEIVVVPFMKTTFVFGQDPLKTKKKIFVEDGFRYISALNKKTALKKFKKGSDGFKSIKLDKSFING
jgi:hypothetical protein